MQSTALQSQLSDTIKKMVIEEPTWRNTQTRMELESLLDFCSLGMESDTEKFLASIILQALHKRYYSSNNYENIYLKHYEIPQIQLFNILIDKFPFVKFGQHITNTLIIDLIRDKEEVCLMDIGVGQGIQMLHIIELARQLPNLKSLTIIGIEPSAEALQIAETNIMAFKGNVHFELHFIPICGFAEQLDYNRIGDISGALIVNASLALHHIQDSIHRDQTISAIKSLNPLACILIEPNSDHCEPDLHARITSCFKHFHSLFKVIDKLDISQDEKGALKQFFGREIEDIISKPESERYEKHEPAVNWIKRLLACGFQIKNDFLPSPFVTKTGVRIQHEEEGFLGFTVDDETALAVICAY